MSVSAPGPDSRAELPDTYSDEGISTATTDRCKCLLASEIAEVRLLELIRSNAYTMYTGYTLQQHTHVYR